MSFVHFTQPDAGAAISETLTALVPSFRKRAPLTEELRRVPQESLDEVIESGMIRMLAPEEFGGLQCTIRQFLDATAIVAGGCPATAWCVSQSTWSAMIIGQYSQEAQQAVWADGPDVLTASIAAGLTARAVPGGYTLCGRGPFASGSDYARWIYPGSMVISENGPPALRFFLIPASEFTVEDTWDTTAMRGTGSKTIVLNDVFVPENFTVSGPDMREGTGPGSLLRDHYLYHLPWVSIVPLIYLSMMFGATRAAFDEVVAALRDKRSPSGKRVAESEALQLQVGMSSAKLDTAEVLLHKLADRADSGQEYSVVERARVNRDAAYAVSLVLEVIDQTMEISGTSGFAENSFVQQAFRDVHFAASHQALGRRLMGSRWGRMMLGVEDQTPLYLY